MGRPAMKYSSNLVEKTVCTSCGEQCLCDSGATNTCASCCKRCTSSRDTYCARKRLERMPHCCNSAVSKEVQKSKAYSGGRSSEAAASTCKASWFICALIPPTNSTVGQGSLGGRSAVGALT